jgi:hypothetical protein
MNIRKSLLALVAGCVVASGSLWAMDDLEKAIYTGPKAVHKAIESGAKVEQKHIDAAVTQIDEINEVGEKQYEMNLSTAEEILDILQHNFQYVGPTTY